MTWVSFGQIANRVVFTLETSINQKEKKMRFHKFRHDHGEIWIDLDQVAMVRDHGRGRTGLGISGFMQEVNEEVQGVLALLQGPPPPDRYEEQAQATEARQDLWAAIMAGEKSVARKIGEDVESAIHRHGLDLNEASSGFGAAASRPADGLEDRPMTAEGDPVDARIRAARLDEIKRLEEDIAERMGFVPERLRTAFDWRRESIRKYGV